MQIGQSDDNGFAKVKACKLRCILLLDSVEILELEKVKILRACAISYVKYHRTTRIYTSHVDITVMSRRFFDLVAAQYRVIQLFPA